MSANVGQVAPDQLQQGLVKCQRQAVLGSLSGIIAHEYNNLMTPVVARAQDALARDDVAAMRKALTITVEQTAAALRFTEQVLALAEGKDVEPQVCGLAGLVKAAIISAVRPFSKDRIELELRVPGDLQIRAQPLLFQQLLLNLLLNARRAMQGRPGKLTISACREDDAVGIAVRDSGVGMSPQMLDEVVNPFLAADANAPPDDGGPVGLGLNVCRTIARRHGATISAQANDGPGCTFQLRWPAG